MNRIKQSILAVVIGLALAAGVSYAQTTWKGAPGNPPNPNADAPINVSVLTQTFGSSSAVGNKQLNMGNGSGILTVLGRLGVSGMTTVSGGLTIPTGAGSGKVLTSDASGVASWQDANSKFKTYQSVWTPIATGENKTFSHMLGTLNTMVYIEGKDAAGQIHQTKLGSDDGQGLKMVFKTDNTVNVKRGVSDDQCNTRNCWKEVRVQMIGW